MVGISSRCSIDITQSRATIDIAINNDARSGLTYCAKRDIHILADTRCSTITTAMDIGRVGRCTHLTTIDVHGDRTRQCAGSIRTAMDTTFYKTAVHIDIHSSASVLAGATKNATRDGGLIGCSINTTILATNSAAQYIYVGCLRCIAIRTAAIDASLNIGFVGDYHISSCIYLTRVAGCSVTATSTKDISTHSTVHHLV